MTDDYDYFIKRIDSSEGFGEKENENENLKKRK